MTQFNHLVEVVTHALHRRFLVLLLAAYAAAALWPAPGLWLRGLNCGAVTLLGEHVLLSLPLALLALLLCNAGLSVKADRLRGLLRKPAVLCGGLAANLVVPLGFLFVAAQALRLWPHGDDGQQMLIGLGLVAAMPIAGSSAAWSQKTEGDTALSLGLVMCSTLFSPLTTPLALHAVGLFLTGEYAVTLHGLADHGAGAFLLVCVALPSLLGLLGHRAVGEARLTPVRPHLQLVNSVVLLVLNYVNAAVSLPTVVAHADWEVLGAMLAVVVALCVLAFAAGWWLAKVLRGDHPRRMALMFGLGMSNNGTGLVLAATALASHPQVMLPVIFYNLAQHLVAAAAVKLTARRGPTPGVGLHQPHAVVGMPRRQQTRSAA
jgi:BASS family bile acid:Na+ symporter